MSGLFGEQHRTLQESFETKRLADAIHENLVQSKIDDQHRYFIESRDFFFLTTVDHRGYPTCSYKGGSPGFIRVIDNQTLAFPSFDGNGMFLSMGNITANPKVGMLLIDFETPHRMRIHGEASIDREDALLKEFHGAELVIRIKLTEVFINCPRYIHRSQRLDNSQYVPQKNCPTPEPQWKRIDVLQEVMPEKNQHVAEKLGGTITPEQYGELVMKGEG